MNAAARSSARSIWLVVCEGISVLRRMVSKKVPVFCLGVAVDEFLELHHEHEHRAKNYRYAQTPETAQTGRLGPGSASFFLVV